jgi:esterase/lipase superfamily enzyme
MATVWFATNRNEIHREDGSIAGFGKEPHRKGAQELRFGSASLDLDEDRAKSVASVDADEIASDYFQVYPEAVDRHPHKLGSRAMRTALTDRLVHRGVDLLVYIHGYNASFGESIGSAAQLEVQINRVYETLKPDLPKHCGPERFEVAVMSWPSNGRLLEYWRDSDETRESQAGIGRALLKLQGYRREVGAEQRKKLADRLGKPVEDVTDTDVLNAMQARLIGCKGRIHLMAHSMGALALRWGLQYFLDHQTGDGPAERLFSQILLSAADEDTDAFADPAKLKALPRLADRVTQYFHAQDRALTVSRFTKHAERRLGQGVPEGRWNVPNLDVVNVSRVVDPEDPPDSHAHAYTRTNDAVLADMVRVLCGLEPDRIGNRRAAADGSHWILEQ